MPSKRSRTARWEVVLGAIGTVVATSLVAPVISSPAAATPPPTVDDATIELAIDGFYSYLTRNAQIDPIVEPCPMLTPEQLGWYTQQWGVIPSTQGYVIDAGLNSDLGDNVSLYCGVDLDAVAASPDPAAPFGVGLEASYLLGATSLESVLAADEGTILVPAVATVGGQLGGRCGSGANSVCLMRWSRNELLISMVVIGPPGAVQQQAMVDMLTAMLPEIVTNLGAAYQDSAGPTTLPSLPPLPGTPTVPATTAGPATTAAAPATTVSVPPTTAAGPTVPPATTAAAPATTAAAPTLPPAPTTVAATAAAPTLPALPPTTLATATTVTAAPTVPPTPTVPPPAPPSTTDAATETSAAPDDSDAPDDTAADETGPGDSEVPDDSASDSNVPDGSDASTSESTDVGSSSPDAGVDGMPEGAFVEGAAKIPAGTPGEVTIVMQSEPDSSGVSFIVRNDTDEPAFDVEISGVARDADGTLVSTGSATVTPTEIPAGGWAMGEIRFGFDSLAGDEEIELAVTGVESETFRSPVMLTVTEATLSAGGYTDELVGIAQNDAAAGVTYPIATVACFDGSELTGVFTGLTDADDVAAGATTPFSINVSAEVTCTSWVVIVEA